jgi:peptidoglycan/xylan/chitin deacetylase (PgdA/CDA1 family)
MRDLKGYGRTPPHANWPGGARVAVSFVINFEEGAEMSLSSGDAFNEKTYEVTDEIAGIPDRCMESHFEYGTKAAWWRIADTLERLGVAATVSTCGQAAELSPWLIEDAVRRGHEISCHGWRWERHAHLKEDEEREKIARTHKVLSEIAGAPVVGWHTRSTPSPNTRRLLVEHGGFLYDSDDYSDDLPFQVQVSGKKHLVIPYSFDTNDMHYHQGFHRFVTARDFAEYTTDAFDTLWQEGERAPKMMSIGLHLRMIGRPGRIAALDRIVGHMRERGAVWFATRRQIAEHWLGHAARERR